MDKREKNICNQINLDLIKIFLVVILIFFCQRPSSLSTQSSLYSYYKSHVTYKDFVGISPSDTITFISQMFDGSFYKSVFGMKVTVS